MVAFIFSNPPHPWRADLAWVMAALGLCRAPALPVLQRLRVQVVTEHSGVSLAATAPTPECVVTPICSSGLGQWHTVSPGPPAAGGRWRSPAPGDSWCPWAFCTPGSGAPCHSGARPAAPPRRWWGSGSEPAARSIGPPYPSGWPPAQLSKEQ